MSLKTGFSTEDINFIVFTYKSREFSTVSYEFCEIYVTYSKLSWLV